MWSLFLAELIQIICYLAPGDCVTIHDQHWLGVPWDPPSDMSQDACCNNIITRIILQSENIVHQLG